MRKRSVYYTKAEKNKTRIFAVSTHSVVFGVSVSGQRRSKSVCVDVQATLGRCGSCITKTHIYNFDRLKPHFYIVKLGFTGVYIIFLISAQKHRLLVLVRTASTRQF